MANEMGYSHVVVSLIYAGTQMLINAFVVYIDFTGHLSFFFIIETLLILTLIYLFLRRLVYRKIKQQDS
jgi:hypothetical protein